jgi:hypothetical protein
VQGAPVIFVFSNTTAVFSESGSSHLVAEQIRENLQGFPNDAVVVWGGLFTYEAVYPALRKVDVRLA